MIEEHLHDADELGWWAGSEVIGTASRLSRSFQEINCPMRPSLAAVSVHLSQRQQLVLAAGDAEKAPAAAPASACVRHHRHRSVSRWGIGSGGGGYDCAQRYDNGYREGEPVAPAVRVEAGGNPFRRNVQGIHDEPERGYARSDHE